MSSIVVPNGSVSSFSSGRPTLLSSSCPTAAMEIDHATSAHNMQAFLTHPHSVSPLMLQLDSGPLVGSSPFIMGDFSAEVESDYTGTGYTTPASDMSTPFSPCYSPPHGGTPGTTSGACHQQRGCTQPQSVFDFDISRLTHLFESIEEHPIPRYLFPDDDVAGSESGGSHTASHCSTSSPFLFTNDALLDSAPSFAATGACDDNFLSLVSDDFVCDDSRPMSGPIKAAKVTKKKAPQAKKPTKKQLQQQQLSSASPPLWSASDLSASVSQHNKATKRPTARRPAGTQNVAATTTDIMMSAYAAATTAAASRAAEGFPALPDSEENVSSLNKLERARRDDMRASFHSLRDQIPEISGNDKCSKCQILQHAAVFAQQLEMDAQRYEVAIEALRRSNEALRSKCLTQSA